MYRFRLSVFVCLVGVVTLGSTGGCGTEPGGVIPSDVVLADNVQLFTADAPVRLTATEGTTYRFSYTGPSPQVAPGDVLLGTENGGYIRRVASVTQDTGSSLSVETMQASLSDAVEEGHFEGTIEINPATFGPADKAQVAAQVGTSGRISLSGLELINVSGLQVDVPSGYIDLRANVDWEIDFGFFRLQYFEAIAEGELDFDIDVRVSANGPGSYELEREIFRLPPKPFVVGLVAGVVNLTFVAGIEVSANGTGTLDTGLASQTSLRLGAYYDGDWHPVSSRSTDVQADQLVWNMDGTVGARAYVRPKIEVLFYLVAGPSFDLEPYLGLDASLGDCFYDWDLRAGVASHINFRIGVLDATVAEFSYELFDWSTTIASDQGDLCLEYVLSTSVRGDGSVSLNPPGEIYEDGTIVALTAHPGTGWHFDHWEGDASGTSPTAIVAMNRDRAVIAVFEEDQGEPDTFVLTTSVEGDGSVVPTGGAYEAGTRVEITAFPGGGWHFDHWEGDASGTTTTTSVLMNRNRHVVAVFEEENACTTDADCDPGEKCADGKCVAEGGADLALTGLLVTRSSSSTRTFASCGFGIINNGPTSLSSEGIFVEYYLSNDTTFGDSDDRKIGDTGFTLSIASGETYPIDLSSTGLRNMTRNWTADLVPNGSYYVYAEVQISDGSPSDPTSGNDYDRTSGTISYTGEGASADFSQQTISGTIAVFVGSNFRWNDFYQIWRIEGDGGGFSGDFNLPTGGTYQLVVDHTTSAAGSCPGGGYSPVTIRVNGTVVANCWDPAENNAGSHGSVIDEWPVNLSAGVNTIEWTACDLCTHYWIRRIEFR